MELTWYGLSCFRITERKHATVVADPFSSKIGLPELKIKGDVVTISHNASGHNYANGVNNYTHMLNGPGEYEIGGVFITGTAPASEAETTKNTIFLFDYNGLTVAHLGDMQNVPPQTQIEALEEVNILLVPVGGGKSLNAAQAAELVSMLEPNIVVPMHYQIPGLTFELDAVDRFLKEMGVNEPKYEDSLKVTSTNSLPEETEIVLLNMKE